MEPSSEAGRIRDRQRISDLEMQVEFDRQLIEFLKTDKIVDVQQIENLEHALVTARRIGAAVGILMVTVQLTDLAAFDLLVRASQQGNRKVRDIAEEVILTGVVPALRR